MNNFEFPVSVYGKLEKYNDVLSKGRCRIFYKYGNRNGTYITDEFSEKLLSTIAYAPVKGIYEYMVLCQKIHIFNGKNMKMRMGLCAHMLVLMS